MSMPDTPTTHPRDADRLIYAGLLGLAAAAVIQLLDRDELDVAQAVAVYAFAAAIPLLAAGIVTDYARREGRIVPPSRDLVGLVGGLAAVTGLGSLFFHFGVVPGAVFICGSFIGLALVRRL
jgi:hypothetical protein